MTIPDFGADGTDALPSLGENVPDPEHPGRRHAGDPDTRDAWPEHDDVVATGREDRRRHVVGAHTGTARCGAPVADVVHGQQADCPDCALYP